MAFVGVSMAYIGMEAWKFLASINWPEVFDTIVKISAALGIGALILFAFLSSLLKSKSKKEIENEQHSCCCGHDVEINVRVS